jgi:uncharacterized protein (TIGR03790 family)
MLKQRRILALVVFILALTSGRASALAPSRLLVVYPANGPDTDKDGQNDSKQLADYYVRRRGIPAANVLGVTISVVQHGLYYTGEYPKFYGELAGPIKSKLEKLGPTSIDVILLVGAIPKEIRNSAGGPVSVDNSLMLLSYLDPKTNNISAVANPYFEPNPTFGTDHGHFGHKLYKYQGHDVYMISRLGSMDQVDHALYAERFLSPEPGYYNGHVYVDSSYGRGGSGSVPPYTEEYLRAQPGVQTGNFGGSEADADMNIAFATQYLKQSGFPLKWENTTNGLVIGRAGAMFSDGTPALNAPRALFYGGWYNYQNYNNVWEWLPGSVACDLNSGSVFGMEALRHGASAASYVLGEPYRTGHQRPNVLLYYLLRGYSFAEASTLATPTMGWMAINEGDPLYTPTAPLMMVPTPEFPKILLKDTFVPVLSPGYPVIMAGPEPADRLIQLVIEEGPEPEVVVAQIEYGTDTKYGTTATSQGYSRRPKVLLKGLQNKTVYHYRVTLNDPVGNTTVMKDYTFDTSDKPR